MDHVLLPYIAPLKPGRPFARRFVLEEIRGVYCVELHFRDRVDARRFAVRLVPHESGQGAFASTGLVDLSLKLTGPPSRDIDLLALSVGKLLSRNMHGLTAQDVRALFSEPAIVDINGTSQERRIDFFVGYRCPAQCRFCTDRKDNDEPPHLSLAELSQRFADAAAQGFTSATLTGLEPTLRPDLPELIRAARHSGFTDVQVVSNGVRLHEPAYMERLLEAGMTVLILSVHAADALTESQLTGVPWLFERKLAALKNAHTLFGSRQIQERRGLFFRTNSVLTVPGLAGLPQLVDLLTEHESYLIPLHFPWIQGRAAAHFASVVPRYPDVKEALGPLAPLLQDPEHPVSVLNLPPCVIEETDIPALRVKTQVSAESDPDAPETAGCARERKMDETLVYPPLCAACSARTRCPGVSSLYLEHYGTAGLAPLS